MWGPMSAVRYAVRANAARIGVDPDKFVQYLPVWERGGVRLRDVFGNPDYVVGNDPANYGWNVWGLNRTAGFSDPAVGLVKPAIVGGRFTILQEIIPNATWGRFYLANRSEFGFQVQNATLKVISIIKAASGNVITSPRGHSVNQKITAAMSWNGTTFTAYSDGIVDGSVTPSTPAALLSGNMSLMGNSANNGSVGATGQYLHIADILTLAQVEQLYYEPYTLLMPVARPVYFDLGASEPTEDRTGPFAITVDSSLGLSGFKGAKGSVSIDHEAAIHASGSKSAKGSTVFSAGAAFLAGGVISQSDDKLGAAIFVDESAVGIGGIKNAFGSFAITNASTFGAGGTTGVFMPELSQASGAAVSSGEIDGSVYTNKNTGTLYAVATLSSTKPSVAQVQAGQNHLGAAAKYSTSQSVTTYGLQAVRASGLASYTEHYWHFQHKDAGGLDSTVITSSAVRTLDISIPLAFSDTAPAMLLTVQVWSKVPKKADVEGLY